MASIQVTRSKIADAAEAHANWAAVSIDHRVDAAMEAGYVVQGLPLPAQRSPGDAQMPRNAFR
jgi:hypothetical protein